MKSGWTFYVIKIIVGTLLFGHDFSYNLQPFPLHLPRIMLNSTFWHDHKDTYMKASEQLQSKSIAESEVRLCVGTVATLHCHCFQESNNFILAPIVFLFTTYHWGWILNCSQLCLGHCIAFSLLESWPIVRGNVWRLTWNLKWHWHSWAKDSWIQTN